MPNALSELASRHPVIWGAGLEAQAVLRRLSEYGLSEIVVAVDRPGRNPALLGHIATIGRGTRVLIGEAAESCLRNADFVIASPSIPRTNPLWSQLRDFDTTTNIWMAEYGRRALAITGSKGKSTTTSLLGRVVSVFRPGVAVGGNIGIPFFDLDPLASDFVIEVGSPQCERLTHSPRGGGITSLFPEHLDFHGSIRSYYAAKLNLFDHGSDFVVASSQAVAVNPRLRNLPGFQMVPGSGFGATLIDDGKRIEVLTPDGCIRPVAPSAMRGAHNLGNLVVALAVAWQSGLDVTDPRVEQAIEQLPQLEHRLQVVERRAGVEWVDDSLATAPQPTAAALAVYSGRPVVLIVGGFDRGVDFAPLADAVKEHGAVTVVAIPENGQRIAEAIRAKAEAVHVILAEDLTEAVRFAADSSSEGWAVIFSPSSPSDHAHVDYRSRSREFREAIKGLS